MEVRQICFNDVTQTGPFHVLSRRFAADCNTSRLLLCSLLHIIQFFVGKFKQHIISTRPAVYCLHYLLPTQTTMEQFTSCLSPEHGNYDEAEISKEFFDNISSAKAAANEWFTISTTNECKPPRPNTVAHSAQSSSSDNHQRGQQLPAAKFFTFDTIEQILNCVPLNVDPRSPNSRKRDAETEQHESEKAREEARLARELEENTAKAVEGRYTKKAEEEMRKRAEKERMAVIAGFDVNGNNGISAMGLAFQEGLMAHTQKLRMTMSNKYCDGGPSTTPARIAGGYSSEGAAQGRNESDHNAQERDTSFEDRDHAEEEEEGVLPGNMTALINNSIHQKINVPGGLWQIPSNEFSNESASEEDGHHGGEANSMRGGGGLMEGFLNEVNGVISDVNHVFNSEFGGGSTSLEDDVLMMRSVSAEDDGYANSGGGDALIINTSYEEKDAATIVTFQELVVNLDERNDDEAKVFAAAMDAMNAVGSPRSLGDDDKYDIEKEDDDSVSSYYPNQFANPKVVSKRGRNNDVRADESREEKEEEQNPATDHLQDLDNEQVNRHFDKLMSSFELALDRDASSGKERAQVMAETTTPRSSNGGSGVFDGALSLQRRKQLHQRRRQQRGRRMRDGSSTNNNHHEEDDISKASYATHQSDASFLEGTTMGSKLTRKTPPPSPITTVPAEVKDEVILQDGSVLDRAKRAVTQVHQTMEAIHKDVVEKQEEFLGEESVVIDGVIEQEDDINVDESCPDDERCVVHPTLDQALAGGREPMEALPCEEEGLSGSGGNSFDSSVNWDALAYSMSDNFSLNDAVTETSANFKQEPKLPKPRLVAGPLTSTNVESEEGASQYGLSHLPVVKIPMKDRIEQIKKRHDEEMSKIRNESIMTLGKLAPSLNASAVGEQDNTTMRADSEEENRPTSPNSIREQQSDVVTQPKSEVQQRLEMMREQHEKNMESMRSALDDLNQDTRTNTPHVPVRNSHADTEKDEKHIAECVGLWKLNAQRFEKAKDLLSSDRNESKDARVTQRRPRRFNFDTTGSPSNRTKTNEDLMLSNLELERGE